MLRKSFKWVITVQWQYNDKDKDEKHECEIRYKRFKEQVLRSVKGAKPKDFNDYRFQFYHITEEPKDVYDYFYACNPLPGDDILDSAEVTIKRVPIATNKTGTVMKEVKVNEKK